MGNLCSGDVGLRAPFQGASEHANAPAVPAGWKPDWPTAFDNGTQACLRVPDDQPTVACAIKAAKAGSRVLISAGIYSETLLVDKNLEFVGSGDVCLRAIDATALSVSNGAACRLENMTIEVRGTHTKAQKNRLEEHSCVEVERGSALKLERCLLHGGHAGVRNGGLAIIMDSEIASSVGKGVVSDEQSKLWMLRCRVHSHALSGVQVAGKDATAFVANTSISLCHSNGFSASLGASSTLEGDTIQDNTDAGVAIADADTRGLIRSNRVCRNGLAGVFIFDGAGAHIRSLARGRTRTHT